MLCHVLQACIEQMGSNCLIDYQPEERADTYRYKTILPARCLLADVHGSTCEAPPPRHHHLADACTLLPATETRSPRNTMISSVGSTTRWGLLLCRALVEFQLPGRLLQLPGRRAPTPGASIPAPIASSPAPRVTYNSQGAFSSGASSSNS
jgi:hypothetical protein